MYRDVYMGVVGNLTGELRLLARNKKVMTKSNTNARVIAAAGSCGYSTCCESR